MSTTKTTIQVNVDRSRKPFARFVLKTPKGVNMVVTVDKESQDQAAPDAALEEALLLLYGALLRALPDRQAKELYHEVIAKLDTV